MDFAKKLDTLAAAENGFEYTVKDIDGVDTDCKIYVLGQGSRVYKQAKAKMEKAEQAALKRGNPLPEEESNELWIELLAKCTTRWEKVEEDGKEIPFSYEEAVRMYSTYPVLTNQITLAVHNIKAMLEGKSASC